MVNCVVSVKDGHRFVFMFSANQRSLLRSALFDAIGTYDPPPCHFTQYDAAELLAIADEMAPGRFWQSS